MCFQQQKEIMALEHRRLLHLFWQNGLKFKKNKVKTKGVKLFQNRSPPISMTMRTGMNKAGKQQMQNNHSHLLKHLHPVAITTQAAPNSPLGLQAMSLRQEAQISNLYPGRLLSSEMKVMMTKKYPRVHQKPDQQQPEAVQAGMKVARITQTSPN
ncbi:hypothetical protein FKM82_002317 [Ascaphus truei]